MIDDTLARRVAVTVVAVALAGCGSGAVVPATSRPAAVSPAAYAPPVASSTPPAATTARVVRDLRLKGADGPIEVGDGWVWLSVGDVTQVGQGSLGITPSLLRVDRATGATTASVDLDANNETVGVDNAGVHLLLSSGVIVDVDPESMRITARHPVSIDCGDACPIALAGGSYWIGHAHTGTLQRVDERTGAVVSTLQVTPASVAATESGEAPMVAAAAGSVWMSMESADRIARIDPASGTIVATYPLPEPWDVDTFLSPASDGGVWLAFFGSGHLVHLDPVTGTARTLSSTVPYAGSAAVIGDDLWVPSHRLGEVWHVDSKADRVVERVSVSSPVRWTATDVQLGTVWVGSGANDVTEINAR